MPPSGHDSRATHAYYDWLYGQYLRRIPVPRTHILWSGPLWIALWAVVLIGFFFLFAFRFKQSHRKGGALYGVSSFAGSILERIGPVSWLNWISWAVITLWALYFIVRHSFFGQVY
ncbi:MAG: hypothetical protein M3176_00180 [Chloroflexota bacterium]|nr:hypothetical protein [Chloroflexota bacterium]